MAVRQDEGFTLVELLVVMIVIGILAAIAIPAFTGQRDSAYRTEAIHDVRKTAVAVETWVAGSATQRQYASLDGLDAAGLSNQGVEVSVGQWTTLRLHATAGVDLYCLQAEHASYAGQTLVYDKRDGVVEVGPNGQVAC